MPTDWASVFMLEISGELVDATAACVLRGSRDSIKRGYEAGNDQRNGYRQDSGHILWNRSAALVYFCIAPP